MISEFPQVEIGPEAVRSVIEDSKAESRLGIDFEFDSSSNRPTIIGVATKSRAAATYWSPDLGQYALEAGVVLSAHAGIGADKVVLDSALQVTTPLSRWSDTMVRFWICNADLASTPKDKWGDDLSDGNAIGFMNLWSVTSMTTDLPHWKGYRNSDGSAGCLYPEECLRENRPCPVHSELMYCAIDAYAGLIADWALVEEMRVRGIPESYYTWRAEVTEAYVKMSNKGIWTDLDVVSALQAEIDDRKANIFPYRLDYSGKLRVPSDKTKLAWFLKAAAPPKVTKKGIVKFNKIPPMPVEKRGPDKKNPVKVYEGPFNPNSPKASWQWFKAHDVELYDKLGKKSVGKEPILKALKKKLKPFGLEFDPKEGEITGALNDIPLPQFDEATELLIRKAQQTCASKGTNSWFNNKTKVPREVIEKGYRDAGLAIPEKIPNFWICRGRANSCGTSTSRIAMSRDNYTNCFDVKTEVLTTNGWKLLKDIDIRTHVAQWENGVLSFVLPEQLTSRLYSGNMVSVSNSHIDFRVTEDHRCLLKHYKKGEITVLAKDYIIGHAVQLHSGSYSGPGLQISDAELKFLVAVQADAWVRPQTKSIDFSFKKLRKRNRLVELLSGYKYTEYSQRRDGSYEFYITDQRLRDLVDEYLRGHDKRFGNWILRLDSRQLGLFVSETKYWDGRFGDLPREYYSVIKDNADWVQIAATLSNRRATVVDCSNNAGCKYQKVGINTKNYSWTTNAIKTEELVANERVYCLSVPSTFVLIRRNGKTAIIGQCPKRGALARCRDAIVAAPGFQLVAADYGQLEFRKCLWEAGCDPGLADPGPDGLDPFQKIAKLAGTDLDDLARRMNATPRDVAKSLVHAADLLESVQLLSSAELGAPNRVKDRDEGALIVYDGVSYPVWTYHGLTVCFTGNNIAERLFGSRTREFRKKALDLIKIYTDTLYPQIREWQIRATREIESTGYASIPEVGHQVKLAVRPGSLEDDLKFLFTTKAQGGGAVYATEGFLRFVNAGVVPSLFVHDENLLCDVIPVSWTEDQIREFFMPMVQMSRFFPGFACPVEIKVGESWMRTKKIGVVRCAEQTYGRK